MNPAQKTLALVTLAAGGSASREFLAAYFARPSILDKAWAGLEVAQVATSAAGRQSLRINCEKVLDKLRVKRGPEQIELGQNGTGGVSNANFSVPEHSGSKNYAPMPAPKPPDPPPKPPDSSGFHAHASHATMPMPSRTPYVHESCNSAEHKKLHDHDEHEVGELSPRTTTALLADIRRLNPAISDEHFGYWRERIEKEDAEAVNAVIRQAKLQRRSIKNIGGWMNRCYLNLVNGKKEES